MSWICHFDSFVSIFSPGRFCWHLLCMWCFFDVQICAPAPCRNSLREVTQEALPRASFAQIVRRTDCAGPCDSDSEAWAQKKDLGNDDDDEEEEEEDDGDSADLHILMAMFFSSRFG
jgi:hypothetical protein